MFFFQNKTIILQKFIFLCFIHVVKIIQKFHTAEHVMLSIENYILYRTSSMLELQNSQ